ncbi:MAG: phosphoesterase RecJ-like protein, partial [Bradymonadia bacterium]
MTARTVVAEALSWGDGVLDGAVDAAVEILRRAGSVLVVGHERPDGDAIGSTLGAAAVARALGCSVTTFNVDAVPSNLQFLPGADAIVHNIDGKHFDVTVMVDCGERHRLGERFPANGWAETVICLDHHKSFDPVVANVICRDPAAPATAEIVYRLMTASGVPLEPGAATALFCALLTDTGSFRYGATTAHAMELGERLLRTGIDVWQISSEVYESNSVERVR